MIPIIDGILDAFASWNKKKAADADAGNISAKITSKELKYTKKAIEEAVRTFELIERHKEDLPKKFLRQVRYRKKKFYNLLAKD